VGHRVADAGGQLLRPDGARTGHGEWSEPEALTEQEFAIAGLLATDGRRATRSSRPRPA
jgi:hypothetical protein